VAGPARPSLEAASTQEQSPLTEVYLINPRLSQSVPSNAAGRAVESFTESDLEGMQSERNDCGHRLEDRQPERPPRQSPVRGPRPRGITSQTRARPAQERCHRSAPQRLPVVDQAGLQMRSFEYEEFAKDAVSQLPKKCRCGGLSRTERREERRCFDEDPRHRERPVRNGSDYDPRPSPPSHSLPVLFKNDYLVDEKLGEAFLNPELVAPNFMAQAYDPTASRLLKDFARRTPSPSGTDQENS